MIEQALDILRNLDTYLANFTSEHGVWVYALLFAIIFAETGLVVVPFLPGDSLLFIVGALSAREDTGLNLWWSMGLLTVAAILGDFVNYHAGKVIGPRVFCKGPDCPVERQTFLERLLNRKHLDRTHDFFERYGGKAVVLGRFVPIVRTFVPFVAGAGAMSYGKFVWFNIAGAIVWVGTCTLAGYFFGNVPWVKKNFEAVVLAIIAISVLPMVIEFVLAKRRAKRAVPAPSDV